MADESANTDAEIQGCVADLKTKIPVADHGALESRVQALINDPDTDNDDVVTILLEEFDPPAEF